MSAPAAGNAGTPLVVSISSDAVACAWQEAGTSCLLRQHLSVIPTGGWVLMPDGHHICFSCALPAHARPRSRPPSLDEPASSRGWGGSGGAAGAAGPAGAAQHLLAVLEPLSLALKGLLRPVSMRRLPALAPG
jgi:hypothetical protein